MLVILAMGAAFGGWTALAVIGAERARRLNQIDAHRPNVTLASASQNLSSPSRSKSATPNREATPGAAAAKNTR